MHWFRFCVLSAALCSAAVLGDGVTTEAPVTIDLLSSSVAPSNSEKTSTSITTTEKPTTEKPTPTEEPTTSTVKPTTTSSTEKPTTTSSTEKPTTTSSTETPTTTQAPTPPPSPTPVPPPEQGKWHFEEKNVTCIIVWFAAQLNVTYTKVVDNSTSLAHVLLDVPANSTVAGGSCGTNGTEQWLKLTWSGTTTPNNMTLVFHRNDTTKNYALKSLNVSLTPELFPNISSNNSIELWHGAEWMTPLATSYRCTTSTRLNMTAETDSVVAALTLSQLQEEAFRTSASDGFSAARECGGGDVPDAVPIAVGCALGGLVVVVLVAYLVGRRRSAARGYLSM